MTHEQVRKVTFMVVTYGKEHGLLLSYDPNY